MKKVGVTVSTCYLANGSMIAPCLYDKFWMFLKICFATRKSMLKVRSKKIYIYGQQHILQIIAHCVYTPTAPAYSVHIIFCVASIKRQTGIPIISYIASRILWLALWSIPCQHVESAYMISRRKALMFAAKFQSLIFVNLGTLNIHV